MTFPCNSQYLWNVWINISLFISGSGGRWRGVGRGIFDMDRDKLLVIWTVQLCVLSVLLISCEQRQIQSWKCFHYLAKGKLFPDEYSNSLDPSSLSHSRQLKWIFNVVIMRYDGVFSGGNYDAVLNNIRATLEPICATTGIFHPVRHVTSYLLIHTWLRIEIYPLFGYAIWIPFCLPIPFLCARLARVS